jgi:hypothetical protein
MEFILLFIDAASRNANPTYIWPAHKMIALLGLTQGL